MPLFATNGISVCSQGSLLRRILLGFVLRHIAIASRGGVCDLSHPYTLHPESFCAKRVLWILSLYPWSWTHCLLRVYCWFNTGMTTRKSTLQIFMVTVFGPQFDRFYTHIGPEVKAGPSDKSIFLKCQHYRHLW